MDQGLGAIVVSMIVIVILGIMMGTVASRPIRAVTQALNRIRQGDTEVELSHKSRDEIGQMFESLAALRDEVGKAFELRQMVEEMPTAVMTAGIEDLKVNYMNKESLRTFKQLEHLLPVKAEDMVGSSIDVFHKNPQHPNQIVGNPNNLPHRAVVDLGDQCRTLMDDVRSAIEVLDQAVRVPEGAHLGIVADAYRWALDELDAMQRQSRPDVEWVMAICSVLELVSRGATGGPAAEWRRRSAGEPG